MSQAALQKCNWCNHVYIKKHGDQSNKYYCKLCASKCYKECRRCHKPFPSLRYFNSATSVHCKACWKVKKKQEEKYKEKQFLLKNLQKIKKKNNTLLYQIAQSKVPIVKQPRKKKKTTTKR